MFCTTRVAMTLLELLAVVVVLGLLGTAVSTAGLWRGRSRAELSSAVATVRTAEVRARLAALDNGGCFRLTPSEMRSEPAATYGSMSAILVDPLPPRVDVSLMVDGRPTDRVVYDARGRSADVEVQVRGSGSEILKAHVNGLTGAWIAAP